MRRDRKRCGGICGAFRWVDAPARIVQYAPFMPDPAKAPVLSVIVPCYNERATVAELLRRVKEVPIDKEIIVIDDKSTDGSRDVVAELAKQWPEIRHILQEV